jgi:predicted nucleic acid-binding protein
VDAAELALEKLRTVVGIVEDLSEGFIKRVARWKVDEPRCKGIADAFLAATAAEHGCPLVTSDHNDFGEIAKSGEVEVIFFR